jgi:hypothetical protein
MATEPQKLHRVSPNESHMVLAKTFQLHESHESLQHFRLSFGQSKRTAQQA